MTVDLKKDLGFGPPPTAEENARLIQYINLKLAALDCPIYGDEVDSDFIDIARSLLDNHQEKNRLLADYHCPADYRIQKYINNLLASVPGTKSSQLPVSTFILDRHGMARTLSIPPNHDSFISDIVSSYRVKQGVLHNPKNDRRTTKGVFHVAEGGMPIADDKKAVPLVTFGRLLKAALKPPRTLMQLPFTANQKEHAETWVSLLLRPTVCPEVPGFISKKSLEIRFFAPGSLVSNLDFVESIFGNAGDPYLPQNDAGLDGEGWTGHSGCVILAPHLIELTKKELGLPNYKDATDRQKRDGMCWKKENELYNDGTPFKITSRNTDGVVVTLIADNYFGYCKKEVKTQIGFSANLFGLSEEEHAGGAIAFASYNLGEETHPDNLLSWSKVKFSELIKNYGSMLEVYPQGYARDKIYENILYVPHDAKFSLVTGKVTWKKKSKEQSLPLLKGHTYVLPSGYKIHMEKITSGSSWRLVGTVGSGTLCHKPCTVSGGGKSEISKSIADAMIQGPVFTADYEKDVKRIKEILKYDFIKRFKNRKPTKPKSRPILSATRSLGSVIKLLTPSEEYTDTYNAWLDDMPHHIREMIFIIKRHYKSEWGDDWESHFGVDRINSKPGHELKFEGRRLPAHYLRVGYEADGGWRIFKLRPDYTASEKVQVEDDITASVTVPRDILKYVHKDNPFPSLKVLQNCEYRLFQRPDDAIHRGYDKQAEADLSSPNTFLSNYEPLTLKDSKNILDDAISYDLYTKPVKDLISGFAEEEKEGYFVSSSHPRMVDGKPCKNPRYLQNRPDIMQPRSRYLAEVGERLFRRVPASEPVTFTVDAILGGRRNNPPDRKNNIPPLAVYNPIHFQELPELFMDFVCSVTGKSPSTTGFGSEGALTKGPFNAIWPTADLNNALVSYIISGYDGFTSAAGYVGPNTRVDHDVSLLIPEIWSRMTVAERSSGYLIANGFLERIEDFKFKGKTVLASRLGYRITEKFVNIFLGRIFNNPYVVFSKEMLRPELQDKSVFAEGVGELVTTQKIVAEHYLNDGSVEAACPPLKALLHIMAEGHFEGRDINHKDIRSLFDRDQVIKSDWYHERLRCRQAREIQRLNKNIKYMSGFISPENIHRSSFSKTVEQRLGNLQNELKLVQSADYLKLIHGTIGADPLHGQIP